MKTMKRYILAMTVAAAMLAATACEDQLGVLPDQKKVVGNVITDEKTAEVALNGVYYAFANSGTHSRILSTRWAQLNEIFPAEAAGFANTFTAYMDDNSAVTPGNYGVGLLWEYCYKLVNAANGVLEQIADAPDDKFSTGRKKEIIAEASFMCAYGHFKLLTWFAQFYDEASPYGVLLRDEFVTTVNLAKARSGVADSYRLILDDLDYAIANGPESNAGQYADRWAAMGLKARVLLMRGNAEDYTEAATLTSRVISESPYALEDNPRDIFQSKGIASGEVMLGIYPFTGQVFRTEQYAFSPTFIIVTYTPSLHAMFEGDPRSSWVINEGNRAITKFNGPKDQESYCMRLTEMYLMNAEAVIRSGGELSAAKARMKTIMGKAGVTDFTALDAIGDREELLYALYEEYVRSLCFEDGIEWLALRRLPFEKVLEQKPAVREKDYMILPIPSSEFEKNPLAGDQNPGYDKI